MGRLDMSILNPEPPAPCFFGPSGTGPSLRERRRRLVDPLFSSSPRTLGGLRAEYRERFPIVSSGSCAPSTPVGGPSSVCLGVPCPELTGTRGRRRCVTRDNKVVVKVFLDGFRQYGVTLHIEKGR